MPRCRDVARALVPAGKILDYCSIAVREFRSSVHPARRFRHTRQSGLQSIQLPGSTLFCHAPGCGLNDHSGITFDHFGTFGNDMIVTCQEGNVYRVNGNANGNGTATFIANVLHLGPN